MAFDELGSTNDEAMARLRSGDPGGLFVTARRQTAGRGRSGRVWVSSPGNLHASLALRDAAPLAHLPQLGFVAGLALVRTIRAFVRDGTGVLLKWPNDVLVGGAKIAGILLETAPLSDGAQGCVIGIGVNCLHHPADLAYRATDLRSWMDVGPDPDLVLRRLASELSLLLASWSRGEGFAFVREAWMRAAAGLGLPISVRVPNGRMDGIFRGIDQAGHLRLERADGLVTISAGDVVLPTHEFEAMTLASVAPQPLLEGVEQDG